MKILISNDDGIRARGLRTIVDALAAIGVEVYVCAPDGERSAAGHSISTSTGPVIMKEEEVPGAVWARSLSGTPADCVKFAVKKFRKEEGLEFDAVFSGINHGSNIGSDVFYSGTVSAAAEGVLCKVPSISLSIDKSRPRDEQLENMIPFIQSLAKKAVPEMAPTTLLNVNFPGCAPEDIKGMKVTRMGPREYDERFEILESPRKKKYFWYSGTVVKYEGLPEDLDIMAHQDDYITVTPLKLDLTDTALIDTVKGWDLLKG